MSLAWFTLATSPAQIADPVVRVTAANAGTNTVTVSVTEATPGAVIRFTLDGSDPTAASASLASGASLSVATSATLKVRAWQGATTSHLVTTRFSLAGQLVAGGGHSLALRKDGSIWSWGDNSSGQLGNGTVSPSSPPAPLSLTGLLPVTSFTATTVPPTDSDGDGLPDLWEIAHGFPPLVSDAASDRNHNGLTALQEYTAGLNPALVDFDGDGLSDYQELIVYLTNPLSADSEADGLPDGWEIRYGTNPNGPDAGANPDNDGLTNLQEFQSGSNPSKADTDDDGLNDGLETPTSRLLADSDGDLLPDGWELMIGSSPTTDNSFENSDNDGMGRGLEHLLGRNPVVADSPVDPSDRALTVYLPTAL